MASVATLPISRALLGVERGRGRFLQHLLVAALQRAVALAQMHDVAVAVGEDLDLDMARMGEVFLHIDGVVAERRLASLRAIDQACDSSARRWRPSCPCRRRRRRP